MDLKIHTAIYSTAITIAMGIGCFIGMNFGQHHPTNTERAAVAKSVQISFDQPMQNQEKETKSIEPVSNAEPLSPNQWRAKFVGIISKESFDIRMESCLTRKLVKHELYMEITEDKECTGQLNEERKKIIDLCQTSKKAHVEDLCKPWFQS